MTTLGDDYTQALAHIRRATGNKAVRVIVQVTDGDALDAAAATLSKEADAETFGAKVEYGPGEVTATILGVPLVVRVAT